MSRYELKEPFHIDDGQLDGLSTQEYFVLGFEYSQICHKMNIFNEVSGQLVHRANVSRLYEAAKARGHTEFIVDEVVGDDTWSRISWKQRD